MPTIGDRIIRDGVMYEYIGGGRWEPVPTGTSAP